MYAVYGNSSMHHV